MSTDYTLMKQVDAAIDYAIEHFQVPPHLYRKSPGSRLHGEHHPSRSTPRDFLSREKKAIECMGIIMPREKSVGAGVTLGEIMKTCGSTVTAGGTIPGGVPSLELFPQSILHPSLKPLYGEIKK